MSHRVRAQRQTPPPARLGSFGRAAAAVLRRLGLAEAGWTWGWLDPSDHPDLAAKTGPDEELLGLCDHDARVLHFLRRHVLADPWPEVRDTLAHEVAHALAGFRAGHGARWQAWAGVLGARTVGGGDTARHGLGLGALPKRRRSPEGERGLTRERPRRDRSGPSPPT